MKFSFFTDTGCVGNSYTNISQKRLFTLVADYHETPYMHILVTPFTVSYIREIKKEHIDVFRIINNTTVLLARFYRATEEATFYKQGMTDLEMSTLLLGLFIRGRSVDQA